MIQSYDKKTEDNKGMSSDNIMTPKKELAGGFESNEEYTYVRGRGRGRYVCSECGIRCKKPSMLKKHIRTHTDVRPYTCLHCAFRYEMKHNKLLLFLVFHKQIKMDHIWKHVGIYNFFNLWMFTFS